MLFLAGVRETSLILLCHTGACPGQEHRASYPICLNVFKAGNPADPHEVEYVLASCFDQHTFVTTSQGRFDFSIFEILRVLCLIMRWRRSASPSTCSSPASFWFSFYLSLSLFFFFFGHTMGMRDLVFLTRDQTCPPCIESMESQPLGHQGGPSPTSCFHISLVSDAHLPTQAPYTLPADGTALVPTLSTWGCTPRRWGWGVAPECSPLGQASLSPSSPAPYSIRTLHTEAPPFHQICIAEPLCGWAAEINTAL